MRHRLCQECGRPGRSLADVVKSTVVEYYRCDACGHVWSHPIDGPADSPPTAVTRPPNSVKTAKTA